MRWAWHAARIRDFIIVYILFVKLEKKQDVRALTRLYQALDRVRCRDLTNTARNLQI
jgi:hypothetical protein